jgi:PTH1 family peptidyl-tRNA hydrolase
MKLIVGLGNPEPQYALTRHNAGFWVVDALATACGASFDLSKDLQARITKTPLAGHSVVLAKPVTYMNLSGRAVQAILHWYKIEPDDMLVVHDDVSLPLGKIRYQHGAGAGGQHGVENIIQMLGGNKAFNRLKFGVGPDPGGDRRANYVLQILPAADMQMRDKVISLCTESIELYLREGLQAAANKYNGLDLRPPPPAPPPQAPAAEAAPPGSAATGAESPAQLQEAAAPHTTLPAGCQNDSALQTDDQ